MYLAHLGEDYRKFYPAEKKYRNPIRTMSCTRVRFRLVSKPVSMLVKKA